MFSLEVYSGVELTHIETNEPVEGSEVILTPGIKVGVPVLFTEIEMLPEGLTAELLPDVEFVVVPGTPVIRRALIVR